MTTRTIESHSVGATQEIGRRLGAALAVGDVVALVGPLGSGKTTLVKGIAVGAGVRDARQVSSPTFVIVNEYEGGAGAGFLHIYHVDAYRLGGSNELAALGLDEMIAQGAVIIEWADRVADLLPPERLTITLEAVAESDRRLHFAAASATAERLIDAAHDGSMTD